MPNTTSLRRYGYTALRSAKLLTLDTLSESGRSRFRQVSDVLGWRTWPGEVPTAHPGEVIPSATQATILELPAHGYNVSALELGLLCQLTRVRRPEALFEIGTYDGRTTVNLAVNAPQCKVVTLDLPPGPAPLRGGIRPGERFIDHECAHRIRQVFGNSLEFDFSEFAGRFDFVFIDAGHSYENCSRDTANAFLLLKPAGSATIIWHDYTRYEGVNRAVDEVMPIHGQRGRFVHLEGTTLALYLRDA